MALFLKSCLSARIMLRASVMVHLNGSTSRVPARTLSYSMTSRQQQKDKQVAEKAAEEPKPATPTEGPEFFNLNKAYKPDNLEKRLLVWTGKYKSFAEVPNMINRDEMERCRSTVRIRVSNILMLLTVVGCIIMVRSGKKAQKEGDSLQKQNQDWHKQYNEANKDKAVDGK